MYFCLQKQAVLQASRGQICMSSASKNTCKMYSGEFTCACRQLACILRKVLAASTQVNLPVFTGKLHVTQVNCVWGLFTCDLQVMLPAFAGNFARASFTVHVIIWQTSGEKNVDVERMIFFPYYKYGGKQQ